MVTSAPLIVDIVVYSQISVEVE
jgi:hypothetical protein